MESRPANSVKIAVLVASAHEIIRVVTTKCSLQNTRVHKDQAMEDLVRDGVVVIPCVPPEKLVSVRKQLRSELIRFPEFKPHSIGVRGGRWVMGGFSALGNPASFHNPTVRLLREWAMVAAVRNLFKKYVRDHKTTKHRLEQIIDRLAIRPIGASATAESWHRDIAVGMAPGDDVFGGWINLDSVNQEFSCVIGSHREARMTDGNGFAPLNNAEADRYKRDPRRSKVQIPPGHMVVFFEQIVHEVVSKKAERVMHRLFTGWRVTKSKEALGSTAALKGKLAAQAVMPLKSGQTPPMYSGRHWTNWRDQIVHFSRGLKEVCRETKAPKSGLNKGKGYDVVHHEMRSLQEYGFPMYRRYQPNEIAMHTPQREWKELRQPGYTTRRLTFKL